MKIELQNIQKGAERGGDKEDADAVEGDRSEDKKQRNKQWKDFISNHRSDYLQIYRTDVSNDIAWFPLMNFLKDHYKTCYQCNYCYGWCDYCKKNIRFSKWEKHQQKDNQKKANQRMSENNRSSDRNSNLRLTDEFRNPLRRNNGNFERISHMTAFQSYRHLVKVNLRWTARRNYSFSTREIWNPNITFWYGRFFILFVVFLVNVLFLVSGFLVAFQDILYRD